MVGEREDGTELAEALRRTGEEAEERPVHWGNWGKGERGEDH